MKGEVEARVDRRETLKAEVEAARGELVRGVEGERGGRGMDPGGSGLRGRWPHGEEGKGVRQHRWGLEGSCNSPLTAVSHQVLSHDWCHITH